MNPINEHVAFASRKLKEARMCLDEINNKPSDRMHLCFARDKVWNLYYEVRDYKSNGYLEGTLFEIMRYDSHMVEIHEILQKAEEAYNGSI